MSLWQKLTNTEVINKDTSSFWIHFYHTILCHAGYGKLDTGWMIVHRAVVYNQINSLIKLTHVKVECTLNSCPRVCGHKLLASQKPLSWGQVQRYVEWNCVRILLPQLYVGSPPLGIEMPMNSTPQETVSAAAGLPLLGSLDFAGFAAMKVRKWTMSRIMWASSVMIEKCLVYILGLTRQNWNKNCDGVYKFKLIGDEWSLPTIFASWIYIQLETATGSMLP